MTRPRMVVLVVLGAAALPGATAVRSAGPAQSDSTRRMAERLTAIFRAQDFRTDPYKNGQRAEYLHQMLADERDPQTRVRIERARGEALLLEGDTAAAIEVLEEARRAARKSGLGAAVERDISTLLTTAYLRAGEQQNCLLHHGAESCLFPIRGSGIHGIKDGSRSAVAELLAALEHDPSDWNARWLLTIASMTLGEAAPKPWQVPTRRFDSEFDPGRFEEVAPALGLNVIGHSGGVITDDFDGDGDIDVVFSSSGPLDQIRFFDNDGDGRFVERTADAGLTGETGGLNIVQTDYDNDGRLDVLVLRGGWLGRHGKYPNSLLRNRGDGRFEDVTEAAGLLSFHPTQVGTWADYDGDGWLDLFVGNESSEQEPHASELFHNNRDGTFTNVAAQVGMADLGYVKGATWGDYDDDGRPDLYVSVKGARNRLLHNEGAQPDGRWAFADMTRRAGVGAPDHSFATWFWDYDNDGRLDLLVTGYYTEGKTDIGAFLLGMPNKVEVPRLYRNDGDGRFDEVAHELGLDRVILAMGANFGDLDNDGWLDCYFGTGIPDYQGLLPNRMFRSDAGRRFQDVTTAGGFGHLQKGHGVAFADLDGDGDQDVVEELGGAYEGDVYTSVVFQNPGHGGHWIRLKLEGVRSNRAAIGARIRVRVLTDTGPRDIHRVVVSGGSFGSSPLEQHVGLGRARAVQEVEIRWPASGVVQTLRNLELDHRYLVREAKDRDD
jgi:hypothetical protein